MGDLPHQPDGHGIAHRADVDQGLGPQIPYLEDEGDAEMVAQRHADHADR
jgi:hypothetical protein